MAEQTKVPMKREDTAPRRWDAAEMFDALQDEMDRMWRNPGLFWSGGLASLLRRSASSGMSWAPRMDVYEKDNNLVVKADLPGLKKEDVQVELNDGGLVIRGENKTQSETTDERYYRMERTAGSFYRRIPLPFEVQASQIQATMNDGVLEVRVPRPAATQSNAQQIQVT